VQDSQRIFSSFYVQLIPRRAGECALPIRAQLRADAEFAQQAERPPGDGGFAQVEV